MGAGGRTKIHGIHGRVGTGMGMGTPGMGKIRSWGRPGAAAPQKGGGTHRAAAPKPEWGPQNPTKRMGTAQSCSPKTWIGTPQKSWGPQEAAAQKPGWGPHNRTWEPTALQPQNQTGDPITRLGTLQPGWKHHGASAPRLDRGSHSPAAAQVAWRPHKAAAP